MTQPASILELIANASPLVQAVMAILLLASLASWVLIFQRWFGLNRVQSEIDDFEDEFWSGIDSCRTQRRTRRTRGRTHGNRDGVRRRVQRIPAAV